MFPESTKLLLIGYLIESTWTLKYKSSTSTPTTNSQTCWQKEISYVTNGTILCVCLTLAVSVLQRVLKWCRKEHKKSQMKTESRWIWSREAVKRLHPCYLLLHQKVPRKQDTKVKFLWVRKLRSTIERRDPLFAKKKRLNPLYAHIHQATQNGMFMRFGLRKSKNLMNWWKM